MKLSDQGFSRHKCQLDTPFLWVDLDLMEENIRQIASFCTENGVKWRPHSKAIKTPAIMQKALSAGAIGVTCAKVSEAEVMALPGSGYLDR